MILILFLTAVLSSSCTAAGPGTGTDAGYAREPYGTWYEQSDFGGVLEITENRIKYTAYENRYTDEVPLTVAAEGPEVLLETKEEDLFTFVDMSYDPAQDLVLVHDWPHTDGDGGWHLIEFRRTPYTPPPAPVYDPPADLSDPDAPKDFDDLTVRAMKVTFYDPGVYHDPDSSMAMEPPFADTYSYDLRVTEKGTALVSSSFCQEIEVPEEIVDELQRLVRECGLGAVNGIDVHTPGLPYGSPYYTLELELLSGDVIRSSANGDNIPENWEKFQEPMHHLLFFAFVDAGYKYINGDFHSTAPMKRLGTDGAGQERRVAYGSVRVEPEWKKSYDYRLHTEYLTFDVTDPDCAGLSDTLEQLEEQYRTAAERSLAEDYKVMESLSGSARKADGNLYCYSFYTVANDKDFGSFYSFLVTEGHACYPDPGNGKYGNYPYWRYNVDVETGKILTAADVFTDSETACRVLTEALRSRYGTYSEEGKFIHSDDFPKELSRFIDRPGPEGISWYAGYDGVEFIFPAALFSMTDYEPHQTLYYDELQDVLNGTYCTVR